MTKLVPNERSSNTRNIPLIYPRRTNPSVLYTILSGVSCVAMFWSGLLFVKSLMRSKKELHFPMRSYSYHHISYIHLVCRINLPPTSSTLSTLGKLLDLFLYHLHGRSLAFQFVTLLEILLVASMPSQPLQ